MTRRASIAPLASTKVLWKESLERMNYGEKLLVHNVTQAQAGSAVASYNSEERRFVTKTAPTGV